MESAFIPRMSYLYMKHLRTAKQTGKQLFDLRKCSIASPGGSRSLCTKPENPGTESQAKPTDIPPEKSKPAENISQKEYLQQLKEARKAAEDKSSQRGPNLALLAAVATGFIGIYFYNKNRMKQHEIAVLRRSISQLDDEVLIGGDWELTNQFGKKMTNKDFEGQWCIIYFGFTHCPDICPDEIEKIVDVMDILGRNPSLPKVRALFVTVDPDRDSPEALKNYLSEFSDKIVGLTGTWEELNKILKAFKVYFSMGPKDEDGDYVVDHSIITYLMNPQGKYEAHFARSKTNVQMANAIEKEMKNWAPKS